MQRELVKILKETELTVNEIEDFSDRCAVQNYQNMLNLCRHKDSDDLQIREVRERSYVCNVNAK